MKKAISKRVITANRQLAKNIYRLELEAPEIARQAAPGQFINFYFPNSLKLFPRPFSIAGVEKDTIRILYKVVGSQTAKMARWKSRTEVPVLGPLGNCFPAPDSVHTHLLIAGGVGAAPLMFLRDSLAADNEKVHFFLGAKNRSELPFKSDPKSALLLSTDDGSLGFAGNVVEHLVRELEACKPPVCLYACGPDQMLRSVQRLALERDLKAYLSLEKVMACGLGLCQGCAVKIRSNGADPQFALVCKDGPVFEAREVILDD